MPDDNLDIEILIAEFERASAQRKIRDDLRKIEDSIEKQNNKLNELWEEMAKEKLKSSKNADCSSVDSSHTCIVIGLKDPFDATTEKANRLTEQYKNGEISKEQYISGIRAIFDELPLDLRQKFGLFLEQEKILKVFSTIGDLSSLIPGLSGLETSMETAELLLNYFQSYAVGGHGAGIRSLIQALSERGVQYCMVGGVILPLAVLSGMPLITASMLSIIISSGILDILKRNDGKPPRN